MKPKCRECGAELPCSASSGSHLCRECDHQFDYCFDKCKNRCRTIREQLAIAFCVKPDWRPSAEAVAQAESMLDKALLIAYRAHHGQVDKGGKPYILHPLYVESQMPVHDTLSRAAALLHDVPEDSKGDTRYSPSDLVSEGIWPEVVSVVDCLTKRSGEAYGAYLERVKGNPEAVPVKLADLEHNSELGRLKTVTDADRERMDKYKRAVEFLKG